MFNQNDFDVFNDRTLEGRMTKIKTIIDPKFEQLAGTLLPILQDKGVIVYSHIAKHLRRTINPPVDTWVAFGPHKKGYKKDPHFEVGFWPDCMFVWLDVLQEARVQEGITSRVMQSEKLVSYLSNNWSISNDHTTSTVVKNTSENLAAIVSKFSNLKTSEFLVGKMWPSNDQFFTLESEKQQTIITDTIVSMLPVYKMLIGE